MGRRLAEGVGTVWVHAEDGRTDDVTGMNMVPFAEGDDIPKWAAEQMGDHCFEKGSKSKDDDSTDPGQGNEPKPYSEWKAPELKAEIEKRNEGRADEGLIVPDGKKNVDLVSAFEADDAASAGA